MAAKLSYKQVRSLHGFELHVQSGLIEICAGFLMTALSLVILFELLPSSISKPVEITGILILTAIVGIILLFTAIFPRSKSILSFCKYTQIEAAITIIFGIIAIIGVFSIQTLLQKNDYKFHPYYVLLPALLWGCMYLMFIGFASKIYRMIVYSQFWLLISIIWLAGLMSFSQLFYIILPYGLIVLAIGIVSFVTYIQDYPRLK